MATRTCKVGVHGRNDETFEEGDYQVIREARIEAIKMMSLTRRDVFQRIKGENPDIEIITRLFHGGGFIEPGQFIQDMLPVMAQLQPFCTMFQIGNEPNHAARIEGWGKEDDDARSFNQWFLQVYAALKQAHPWAQLGFPGLAVPDPAHRDRAWLRLCRDAINRADWLGCHCYWQTPPGGGSVMLEEHSGLCFKYYHEMYPDKVIHILECGNSNGQNPAFSTDENLYAEEYVTWLNEVFKYPYLGSASFFILSSPDPNWRSFAWRRNGHITNIVARIGNMPRPPLRPVLTGQPPVTPPITPPPVTTGAAPIGVIPNVFTNQHLINAFFFLAGELGIKGDELMANAGLNLLQLAADEQTRQRRYSGTPVDNLPGLADDRRARIKAHLVRELRNVKRWSGVVNAPAGLNLRAQPSTEATVLLGLTDQTVVEALNDDDPHSEWLFVATSEGAAGFVARRFVRRTDVPTPVAVGQPTPRALAEVVTMTAPAQATQAVALPMPGPFISQPGEPQAMDPELLAAWRKHVEQGLENNNIMFNRVLRAFMTPYYLTVTMYILLFLVGVGLFVVAAWLSYANRGDTTVYFFGGLGVVTFLAFFVSKPLRALEENLQFITWLGIVYNTYWTRLLYMQDSTTVHTDLKDATSQAETSIDKLIDKNTALSKERPGFSIR